MTVGDMLPIIEEELEPYRQRLAFLDLYDSLVTRLSTALCDTMNRQQERIACMCDMMSGNGGAWVSAEMAATKIRAGEY